MRGSEKEKQRIDLELTKVEDQIRNLETQRRELEKAAAALDDDIAVGLKVAARNAGVKLEIGGKQVSGNGKRISKADMDNATNVLTKALPSKGKTFRTVSQLVKVTKLDGLVIKSALQKLKRENVAVSNGKRGLASGWTKA